MPDPDYREDPITFERGVNEYVEASMLPQGACAQLRNWQSDPSGGLRARVGWSKGSTTGAPATRKGMGIGYMAIPHRPYCVQRATNTGSGVDPEDLTATWGAATTAGNLLVAKLTVSGNAALPSAYTITPPADWVSVGAPNETSRNAHAWIYYKANAASQSGAVTFTVDRGDAGVTFAWAIEVSEVANIATSSPLDQYATANNNATTTCSTGTTAAVAVQVGWATSVIGGGDYNGDTTFASPTNDFTEITEFYLDSGSLDINSVTHEKLYETGGTLGHTSTAGNAMTSCGIIACFKAADYDTADGYYFLANNDTTEIDIHKIDSDSLSAGTWTSLETVSVSPGNLPVAFTSGLGCLVYTHSSFTGVRKWTGSGSPSEITGSPVGARCVAFHKNRMFVGGTLGQPSRLYFSALGDVDTWTATNYIDVGLDDGESIEEVCPSENNLIIAKQTSLYMLAGSGIDSFVLTRLPTGGAAPGRTIMATPYGAVVAGRHHVWLAAGGSVSLISRPISSSYGITGNYMTSSFINDYYYVTDSATGNVWALNMETGTWHEERMPTNEGPAILYNHDEKQLMAPINATVGSIINYRQMPGSSRAKDYDTLAETYTMWTPELWPVGPDAKITPRWLFLKIRQRAGDANDTGVTVTPYYNGTAATGITLTPAATAGVRRYRVDLGSQQGISSVQFRFSQVLASTETAVLDIEEATFGYYVEWVR